MKANDLIMASPVYVEGFLMDSDASQLFLGNAGNGKGTVELLLVIEGNGKVVMGSKKYKASPGTLLINQQEAWGTKEIDPAFRFKALLLRFSSLQLKGLPENRLLKEEGLPVLKLGNGFTDYEQLFRQIILEGEGDFPEAGLLTNAYLSILIGKLVRRLYHRPEEPKKRHSSAEEAIFVVKQLIEERYQENWTLTSLGEKVYLSPSHLCRQFKRKVGWSPVQYLIHCRVEAAKYVLANSNETMSEIADNIGYQSETHFHQVFKKNTGITPGHYRELHRDKESFY
jgi:AraC-like DNA-binding protein